MKKLLCLLSVLMSLTTAVFADDVPYRQQRRDHFSQLPITSETTVFLGNSITNFGVWPEIFAGNNTQVVNRGISGNFSKEVMVYFNHIINSKPKAIYLMIGINDVTEQSDIVPSVRRMLTVAREVSPQTTIYVQSILPTTNTSGGDRSTIPTTVNPKLQTLCEGFSNAFYIDVFTKMNEAGVSNVMDDNLHPTWKGYRIWANVIEEKTGLKSNFDQTATYTYFTGKNFVDRMLGSYSILPVNNDDVLMLGDGIVQQGEWAELFSGAANVKNRGMGLNQNNVYSLTSDKLEAVVPKVLHDNATPAKVFVEVGRTDALNGTAAATIVSNIETGVEKILSLSPNTMVYVQSIIPMRDATKNTSIIVPANESLKTWCESKAGVGYIDLYSSFIDSDNKLAAKYQSSYSSGYGANIALYRKWANLIAKEVGATALSELAEGYSTVKPSTQTETHWYTFTANSRYGGGPNMYVSSTGAEAGLTGALFNGKPAQQWKFVARNGGYDIINRETGAYISPSAATNSQIMTSATQPSAVWTVESVGSNSFCIIKSGTAEFNQTTSAHSNQIYNWGDGTNITDPGCLFYIEEAGYAFDGSESEEEEEGETTTPQISRKNWQISATWPHTATGTTGDGGAAWVIDENTDGTPNYNTWYHTDWSTDHGAVQGFMIDMGETYDVCKVHFEGRTTNGYKGLPTKYRLYAFETAPFALSEISVANISTSNTKLGTPVSSGSHSWTSSSSRQSCDITFDKTKARYMLFVWDEVTYTYPACSDFQVYRPATNPIDDYTEPRVGTTPDATEWGAVSAGLHASWASRDELYSLHHVPTLVERSDTTINAWKGERANLEAVLFSNTDQGKLTVRLSSPSRGGQVGSWGLDGTCSARFLNYVITDDYKACGTHDMSLTQWLVPDVIDQDKAHSVPAKETRPVWCSIQIPRDIDAGRYTTDLEVINESGQTLKTLKLTINVNEHSLPAVADQKFHLDLWQQPYAVSRYYGVDRWSDGHIANLRPYLKALGDAGQKVVSAIMFYEPWGDQSYDKFSAMVETTKKSDGTWSYDYTIFDKYVDLCAEYGIKDQIDCYSMVPWDMTFRYYDESTKADVDLKTTTSSDDYKNLWTSFLTSFKAHLQAKGWFDKTCLAMDERGETDMLNAYSIASGLGFKMALAGNYHSSMVEKLQDYCLAPTQLQYLTTANQEYRKQNNLTTTFYTSCSESEPNVYSNSFPAEATYLPLFAAANNLDGYLHWSWLNWGESPLTDSRYRLFGSGDTYMYYPGNRSSVRFERLIEGIHQYEKIQILKEEYKNDQPKSDSLNAVLNLCKDFAISGEDCAAVVNRIEDFLNGKKVDIPESFDGYWKIRIDDTHYAKSAANQTEWSTEMSSQTDYDLFRIEGTDDACTIKLMGRSNNIGPDKNMQMFVDQTASTKYSIVRQANGKVKLKNNGYWVYVDGGTFSWNKTSSTEFELIYVMDAKDPVRTTLFSTLSGGMDIPPYRIPGISCGKDGRLIATAARLVCGTDPGYGQVDVVCRLSDDNGQTWSEIKDVAVGDASLINNVKTPMEAAYGDPAVVYDRESDEVLVMAVGGCTVFTNSTTNRQNPNIIASIRSLDGGNTWQKPIEQTEDIYSLFDSGNALAAAFVGGGKIFQSRIIKVGQYYRIYAALAARPNGNRVVYSDDFGRTWKALGGASALPVPSGDEPKCEELPDGRVIITSRVASGRYFNIYDYTDRKTGAGSWESVTKCTFSGLSASPSSNPTNGELLIVPVKRNSDGKEMHLALQSVPTGSSRVNVGIFYKELLDDTDMKSVTEFSTDWDGFYQVSSTVSAYSSLDLQADGKIGFFYEETLTKWGTKQNPVSTSFPTGAGTHNFDGFENIYVPLDLELITGGRYSVRQVTPTGITEVPSSKFQDSTPSHIGEDWNEALYDLTGRKTTFPQKGTIYVSNGHKAIY